MQRTSVGTAKTFLLELLKPSHYDDDGYVIQWWRGNVPSNSLSNLYGLAQDARQRQVLGRDVEIELGVLDETTAVLPIRRLIRRFKRNGLNGLVCLVGVQTNQFPRALDIARQLRRAGIQVAIGGFHVSGCLAMLPDLPPISREAQALGICLFAGEAEGRLDDLLRAAHERRLAPIYNFMKDLPGLEAQPLPLLPQRDVRRYLGNIASFDAGRGCPFTCSFCTIINVQGRKSRYRTADDVEDLIRASAAQGIRSYFITDDNFARNKNWEAILDRIIELRHTHGFRIHLNMQVDTMCHKIPNFVEKAARAGCTKVFIGLENINPANLKGASKGQNQITEYRAMLQAWRKAKVLTFAGLHPRLSQRHAGEHRARHRGHPTRAPHRHARVLHADPVARLQGSPGSVPEGDAAGSRHEPLRQRACHLRASAHDRRAVDVDLRTRLAPLLLAAAHRDAAQARGGQAAASPRRVAEATFYFYATAVYERVHPLQGGLIRRKCRSQRRWGMPRENPLVFALRRVREMFATYVPMVRLFWTIDRLRRRVQRDPLQPLVLRPRDHPRRRRAGRRSRAVPDVGRRPAGRRPGQGARPVAARRIRGGALTPGRRRAPLGVAVTGGPTSRAATRISAGVGSVPDPRVVARLPAHSRCGNMRGNGIRSARQLAALRR